MANGNLITDYKLTTGIERVFRHVPNVKIPGFDSNLLYVEVLMHFLIYKDPASGEVVNQKLQKQVLGQIYKKVVPGEQVTRSSHGEIDYQFPNGDKPERLIGLGIFWNS